ncbi:MAG: thiamine-phosphate kinase [Terracidiphilus sp.]
MRTKRSESIPNGNSSELALVERIRRRAARSANAGLVLGIGDDCALLRVKKGETLAVTTDLSIAGRHFRLDWHPPEAVGHRTLARGLSDLAAMGARPLAAFLSIGLPREITVGRGRSRAWVDRFFDGFLDLAGRYKTPLAGGDLAESSVLVADIVLVGAVPRGKALLRSGARPGDLLFVTGALGGAAAGLEKLKKLPGRLGAGIRHTKEALLTHHLWPEPRIAQGLWLRRREAATAGIDLSDGLSTDLDHLCQESGVSAEIDAEAIPIHAGASLDQALHGGEDYELLFAARPNAAIPRSIAGISVTKIGRIVKNCMGQPRVVVHTRSGRQPLERRGWEHFS